MWHPSQLSFIVTLAFSQPAAACTYFEVRSPAGAPTVVANTLEWFSQDGVFPDSKLWKAVVSPRGQEYKSACKGGDAWKGKLGFLGMGLSKRLPGKVMDTLNEAGLSVSEHALRGVASYKPPNPTSTHCKLDFGTFISASFSTVAEVRKALPSVAVLFDGSGSTSSPGLQWAVADTAGESIVIDFIGGALNIYNNSGVGVLSNDPEYPWQVQNLNNYVGLSPAWPGDNKRIAVPSEFGQAPSVVGHGQNLLGLPGDVSPASRFVRTFFIRQYALAGSPPKTMEEALVLADGVLNTQFIVKGMNAKLPLEPGYDHVIFATMKVPEKNLYFYKTYEDSRWRRIDLSAVDFNHRSSTLASTSTFGAMDVTDELKPDALIV